MAREVPGLSPHDWSITDQEDGTVRLTRTDAWRDAATFRRVLRGAGWITAYVWLWGAAAQLPVGLRWFSSLALVVAAPLILVSLVAAVYAVYRRLFERQVFILGTDFLEDHRQSRSGWQIKSFHECTVHLVEQSHPRVGASLWFLHLDGESARQQGIADRVGNPYCPPAGWVLYTAADPNAVREARALGELIAATTRWPFLIHPGDSEGNPAT